tara:strand:- start:1488 stop:1652 length:165 start_codon:yes stop_codon:yes gene_type:complete
MAFTIPENITEYRSESEIESAKSILETLKGKTFNEIKYIARLVADIAEYNSKLV